MRRSLIPVCIFIAAAVLLGAWGYASFFSTGTETAHNTASRTADLGLFLLDEEEGVFVLAIAERSPAGRAGFQAGDVLLSAGSVTLTSALQLEELLAGEDSSLSIHLKRNDQQMHIVLPTRKELVNRPRFRYTNLRNGGDQP